MDERRQQNRYNTELQLEVYDLHSEEYLGRVVDLSSEGFMLFCNTEIAVDSIIAGRLKCAQTIEGLSDITFGAECLWSRPGADGQHGWAGFHIIDLAEEHEATLQALLKLH
ncbi:MULTISPECIES: PilZ domain-containing protein [Pseudomonas]|uniref:Pilus assembly protein PilZ n=1 Tax=Pseudomonas marincola TaxID=437900 RepID=A0A653DZX1_9PSED|nr:MULTISPECIES: PilZ domain-containing protein [Pseudomonas]NRH27216.1 PilZ domain-containing protein [Pseudomonas sp. MS19]OEO27153.1 pilus assembly protein PilZ [Pseudomonas sp. J237]CAE6943625.1 Pilus assembly protein PilZ [Pseudomonas marincola]|tara:strand:- start:868 stop:1200 length:333 start_codon:yes stop_codon:yes gene_type:complete